MKLSEEELKPCPFCGVVPTLQKDELINSWFLECQDETCIASPSCLEPDTPKEKVIQAWNHRLLDANGGEKEDERIFKSNRSLKINSECL